MSVKRRIRQKQEEKIKKQKRKEKSSKYIEYRELWKEKGPVWFAENVLTCPADVPEYPNWKDLQERYVCEGCEKTHWKFRRNGTPYHIVLSGYQKSFLMDLWKGENELVLVTAARGAGKTLILAVWYCWLLATHEKYSVTFMGGSSKQSKICQSYIDDWRYDVPVLYKIMDRSLKGIERYITTIWKGRIDFSACSSESARGPHVNEVALDEVATAEDKSEEGSKAVKAAMWQITGKRIGRLVMASTTHYIHGMFYEYMTHPEKYGFKVYQWAIAKHVTDKKAIEVYTDKDQSHWLSNVWWLTNEEIRKFRRTKSDEEFLCEGLGGASMASGAVFKKKDLDLIICDLCEECEPYNWDKCKLCQLGKL